VGGAHPTITDLYFLSSMSRLALSARTLVQGVLPTYLIEGWS
jgi:hypothetical protein